MTETSVLHVLAPGREGGLERVVQMLASAQGARAHVAAVLTPEEASGHPFVEGLVSRGIPHTAVIATRRGYIGEYRDLRALVARLRPGVIHTHGFRPDIIAGRAARAANIPVVSTLHGFTSGVEHPLNRFLHNRALRSANAVIAVSAPVAERLAGIGVSPERIRVVANGFVSMGVLAARSDARRELGLTDSGLIAVWVGRLSQEKGADVMIDALALTDSAWRLSVMGSGVERQELVAHAARRGVTDRINWHGSVRQAGAMLQAFDAFVLSSRTEGTPIALLEAMAAEVPIVATRVGGVPDVVGDAEAILVRSEHPAEIAEALAAIRMDPAAARRRAQAAHIRLDQNFGAAPWLEAVEGVYNSVRRSTP